MATLVEPEVLWGRRAFTMAQALLGSLGVPTDRLPGRSAVGWHGTQVESERGSFAVVANGAGLDDLVGELLRVSYRRRAVFVYVLGARAVPTPISLDRRAFLGLALLSHESIECVVEVLR